MVKVRISMEDLKKQNFSNEKIITLEDATEGNLPEQLFGEVLLHALQRTQ